MLGSTFELFSLAASNSLAVFCFCNLIIGIILVSGNSKSNQSSPSQSILRYENAASLSTDSIKVNKEDGEEDQLSSAHMADERWPSPITRTDETPENNAVFSSEKANESTKSNYHDQKLLSVSIAMDEITLEEENNHNREDGDELRKRIEEFIEKINREWRDEKLETFS